MSRGRRFSETLIEIPSFLWRCDFQKWDSYFVGKACPFLGNKTNKIDKIPSKPPNATKITIKYIKCRHKRTWKKQKKKMKIRNLRHYKNTQILRKEEVVYITWPSIILSTFNFLVSFFPIMALACSNICIKHFIKISIFDSHNKVIFSILYFFFLFFYFVSWVFALL